MGSLVFLRRAQCFQFFADPEYLHFIEMIKHEIWRVQSVSCKAGRNPLKQFGMMEISVEMMFQFFATKEEMVKAYKQEHVYKHPWEIVTSASWRKFADPENKRTLSHILDVDTLNHKLDTESGKLYATRAISIHAPGPWFVRKIVGQDICHCVESTVVDGQSRSMQLTTRNVSLQKFIEVEERIRYYPHPDNPRGWTMCKQETSIRIKPLSKLASMAEKAEQRCAERFLQNSVKGREVMERICKYLESESRGITF